MRNQFTYSTKVGLTVLLGALGGAQGIERPGGAPAEKAPSTVVPVQDQTTDVAEVQKPVAGKQAFLGVSGDPVSEDLAWHLNLKSGLQLTFVLKGSPADLAGLSERDIVTSIDGKKVSSQEELRAAVQARVPGDEIVLKYVRRGNPFEKKVELSGRAPVHAHVDQMNPFPADEGHDDLPEAPGRIDELTGNLPQELQRLLLEEVERAKKWGLGPGKGPQLQDDIHELLDQEIGFKAAGSIMFQDKNGSVEMRMTDGSREISIRNIDGEIVFEGPYDSDADKAAVPEEYRERVEKLGLDMEGSGRKYRFEINGKKQKE